MWWNGPASSSKLLYRGEYFLRAFYRISNSSSEHLLAKLSACCTQAQKAQVQIAVATLSGNSLRQTVHTHRASVHQAAKLVAALLRVAGVTAGLGRKQWQPAAGFMTHVTFRLTAKNWDQLQNLTLCSQVWATLTFYK